MVGNAIYKAFKNAGYGNSKYGGKLLIPRRKDLNLLKKEDLFNWFNSNKPDVVILAAAKVGGILANSLSPVDFLLDNIKIQTNVIEAAWRFNCKRLLFLEVVAYIQNLLNNQ